MLFVKRTINNEFGVAASKGLTSSKWSSMQNVECRIGSDRPDALAMVDDGKDGVKGQRNRLNRMAYEYGI